MATREENLKKINDELEKLSDDELEKVAGGKSSWLGMVGIENPNTATASNQLNILKRPVDKL